jgi:hypothetical protein
MISMYDTIGIVDATKKSRMEGEGNHSTSVISRLGLVGGGGAVVMV